MRSVNRRGFNLSRVQQKGASLIELLVATTTGVIVLGSAVTLFLTGQKMAVERTKQLAYIHSLNTTLNYIKRDIKRAGYNGTAGSSLKLSGASNVIEIDASGVNLNSIEYVFKNPDDEFEMVKISKDINPSTIDICRQTSTSIPSLGSCTASFSLLDTDIVALDSFEITQTDLVTSAATSTQLEISIALLDTVGNLQAQDSIKIKQRNWQ